MLRAVQQPIGAEVVDGMKKDEHMIVKYVIAIKKMQHFQLIIDIKTVFRMTRLKDEMEAVAWELQKNNSMIERYDLLLQALMFMR